MSRVKHYDYIIAGAGAAGMTLLWNLLNSSLRKKNILLIDRSLDPKNDKTWCFWADENVPYGDLIYHSWENLEVKAKGNRYVQSLSDYGYHCIRSVDHFSYIRDMAKSVNTVTMLEADIIGFTTSGERAKVDTSVGIFEADWIFQSAIKPPSLDRAVSDIRLKQHFLGWEIETPSPLFDPNKVTLMDFDVPQKNGVTFLYELPFQPNKSLIEYTLFSDKLLDEEEYTKGLELYIADKYSLKPGDFTIHRHEKGVIPMEDTRYPGWYTQRVMNIGTVGGLTKPTTGYTFTRIHHHSKQIIEALEQGNTPPVSNGSDYRFRVYDIMLLYLLQHHHETSIEIFNRLFQKNRFDRILQFLEEKTHIGQELGIFSTLPYTPFFKAIWKMKHRIFSGA